MKVNIQCSTVGGASTVVQVVGLDWYNGRHGYIEQDCPALAVCYYNGSMQIMHNETDES